MKRCKKCGRVISWKIGEKAMNTATVTDHSLICGLCADCYVKVEKCVVLMLPDMIPTVMLKTIIRK